MRICQEQQPSAWVAPAEGELRHFVGTGWVYPEGWEDPVIAEEVCEYRLGAFGLHRDEYFGEVYWYWWGPDIEWAWRLFLLLTPAVVGMCLLAPLFAVRQAQAAWSRWVCCLMILVCLGWPGAFIEVLDTDSELHHSIGLALAAVILCAVAARSHDGLPPAARLRAAFVLAALSLAALGVLPFYMVEAGHPLVIYLAMPAALLLLTPIACFKRLARPTLQNGAQHA